MAQPVMHAQMGGEISGAEELIQAGGVTFGLEYRRLPGRAYRPRIGGEFHRTLLWNSGSARALPSRSLETAGDFALAFSQFRLSAESERERHDVCGFYTVLPLDWENWSRI